jgi:predicted ABC-type ATPase
MNIYIIAGPPGVGKSSSSFRYIPDIVPIIDQDLAAYQYRKDGFRDYQQLATLGVNQKIKDHLFQNKDFALELNLGFQSHYDYLKSIAYFDLINQIHLIMYFTDSLELCISRAETRYKNDGHLVEEAIVTEMFENTFPLFKENERLFSSMKFLDVSKKGIVEVSSNHIPNWIKENDLTEYLIV